MGGRKQKKKINLTRSKKEAFVFSNHSAPARNLKKTDLGAVIFGTTNNTINECLSRQLFGLPEGHFSYIKNIKEGLVIFIFNYSDRKLHGVFEAAGHGQMNIDQYAWVTDEDATGYTRYPAQVKIRVRNLCHPLSEDQFQPIIAQNYYESNHFYFELDMDQTNKLVSLFASSSTKFNTSTKWKTLYASLPTSSKRQEPVVHVSQGMTQLRQALPENLHQISKVSYASALAGPNNATASSSQPVGEWRDLFKSELGSQVNPTRDDLLVNEGYEDKGDFVQAETWEEIWSSDRNPQANTATNNADAIVGNTWEESQRDATDGAESDQSWSSDLHHQVNTLINDDDVMLGNTWDESQHVSSTTCEVEHGQTSGMNGQRIAKPSSSSQHLEDNLDDTILVPNRVETVTDLRPLLSNLMQEFEGMKGSQLKLIVKTNRLEQELASSKLEIQQLKNQVRGLESRSIVDPTEAENQLSSKYLGRLPDSVFIVGGHDGSSWLPTVDSYFPSHDIKISLSPMNIVKSYASAATLNGEIYHFGGDGSHTVEAFNPTNNQWILRPESYWKNKNVAGASVQDKLYVVGGAIGPHCSSEVEYLDMNIGSWLPARSMLSKRLAPAAAELNNVLYVSGGYDGESYTSSVERFDPREQFWCKVPNMNARKGCHSMIVMNEKLYTVGGYSGDRYLPTVEYLDTRMGGWVEAEPMNVSRGNFGIFLLGGMMYTVGGRNENVEVLDIVECYKEVGCWEVASNLKAIGKRSHFSAFVM